MELLCFNSVARFYGVNVVKMKLMMAGGVGLSVKYFYYLCGILFLKFKRNILFV